MAEPEGMDVDSPAVPSTSSGSNKKRFEVKKVDMLLNRFLHVRLPCVTFSFSLKLIISFSFMAVECCCFVGMG